MVMVCAMSKLINSSSSIAVSYTHLTLAVLAEALKQIYAKIDLKHGETKIKVIGTRHGEKLYETLVTRDVYKRQADDNGVSEFQPCKSSF